MRYTINSNNRIKSLIGFLLFYLLCKIMFSTVALEVLLQNVPLEGKLIARITAIFSLIFSAFYSWLLIIALFSSVWYASKLCFEKLPFNSLILAFQTTTIIFIATEFLKLGFVWLFLLDEIPLIDLTSSSLISQIENTNYHKFSHIADNFSIGATCLFFYIELDQKVVPKLAISCIFMLAYLIITLI